MTRVAAGTVVTTNYLSFARTLERSFHEHHPDVPFFVLLADEAGEAFDPAVEHFRILLLDSMSLPQLERFQFRYSRHYVAVAAKPYLLQFLLDSGYERAIYLDADVLVTSDIDPLLFPSHSYSIALTPHLLSPASGELRIEGELTILRAGVYNAGFVAVSESPSGRDFLSWWQDRLHLHCRHDLPNAMHADQRWLDLVPHFFDGVRIIRDPTCNVAYWNLEERSLAWVDGTLTVFGQPCRFFHFSGFDPDAPRLTRHSDGPDTSRTNSVSALFARYAAMLKAAGFDETKDLPHAYQRFDNGVEIPEIARGRYLEFGDAVDGFGNPFKTASPGSYYRWLTESPDIEVEPSRRINHLWEAIYRKRPDVQAAFPDYRGTHRDAFLEWARTSGAREHGIGKEFLK